MHVLAPLEHYRPVAQHQELEGGEHSRRSRSHDDHRFSAGNVPVFVQAVLRAGLGLVVSLHLVDHLHVTAGIYRAVHYTAGRLRALHHGLG